MAGGEDGTYHRRSRILRVRAPQEEAPALPRLERSTTAVRPAATTGRADLDDTAQLGMHRRLAVAARCRSHLAPTPLCPCASTPPRHRLSSPLTPTAPLISAAGSILQRLLIARGHWFWRGLGMPPCKDQRSSAELRSSHYQLPPWKSIISHQSPSQDAPYPLWQRSNRAKIEVRFIVKPGLVHSNFSVSQLRRAHVED